MARNPPPIVSLLLACDALLTSLYVADAAAGRPIPRLTRLVDLNGEANLPAWFSSTQWLLCSVVFGLFALRNVQWTVRRSWLLLLLPALFIALSLDEVAQIHESLGRASDVLLPGGNRYASPFPVTGVWMFVVGAPFVAFLLSLGLGVRPYFVGASGALVRAAVGMGIMLAGAIGVETLSNYAVAGSALATVQVVVEEFLEMVGGTLVLWGGLHLLATHGFAVRLDAVVTGTSDVVTPSEWSSNAVQPPQNT